MTDTTNFPVWPGWETVRLIGRGSFGTVYEIERAIFDDVEKAALKVISIPQNSSDIDEMQSDGYDDESITSAFKDYLKSIVAEYSLMRRMNGSANIVNCDDVRYVQHGDGIGWDIFIKMELLTPLVKALPGKTDESTVVKLALDLTAALELCRKYNIVHRDIKPANIFVSENGDYKLGDFGIAKTVEKTMGGTKTGTYKYMAPEVYNNQPYGSAADIYSLGLVLYWLLNERRLPFLPLPPAKLSAGMDEQARNRRLSGEAIPAPKNGSEELKRIVLKACEYDVNKRYHTAAEMHAALEAIALPAPTPLSFDASAEDRESGDTIGVIPLPVKVKAADASTQIKAAPCPEAEKSAPAEASKVKPKASKKKRIMICAMLAAVIAAALILRFAVPGVPKKQTEWSEWADELPRGVNAENYDIEEKTLYRSRDKETSDSTVSDKQDGWDYIGCSDAGEFGEWSEWSTDEVSASDTREVETETRRRSRSVETTVSGSSALEGWELVDTTYEYGEWVAGNVYYPSSHAVFAPSTNETDVYKVVEVPCYCAVRIPQETDFGLGRIFGELPNWSLEPPEYDPSTRMLKTGVARIVYTRTKTPVYHFQRTGSWSDWQSTQMTESDSRQVEAAEFYRFREKTDAVVYHFSRWSEWSDWSETPAAENGDNEVETKTVYRYISK